MNRSKRDPAPPDLAARLPAGLDARWRGPLMSYFLRRTSGRAEAEDLTQEVFLRILGRDEQAAIDNVEVYVFQIAANLLRDRVRRRGARRVEQHFSLDAGPNDRDAAPKADGLIDDRGPERVLLAQQSLAEVMHALDDLGERTRDIFILYRLEKMRHRQIADLYGLSVSSVEKYVIKAVAHLASRFGAHGEGRS